MEMPEAWHEAQNNIEILARNPYPGRGIIAGLDGTGKNLVQVYWIMGRSENSRNRVFSKEGGRLYTEAADPKKMKDPSLIIYNAMDEIGLIQEAPRNFVVSNGNQTDKFIGCAGADVSLGSAMRQTTYEPDEPNYTQRITAVSSIYEKPTIEMFIHRKSSFGARCDRIRYLYDGLAAMVGFYISTYSGDGDPLPSFRSDPWLMPLQGGMRDIGALYWSALNEENRVALAVKFIRVKDRHSSIHIINKYEKVG
jgi:IMP cyclohydrolase